MDSFGIGTAGLVMAGLASIGAFVLAFRQRRRRQAARPLTARTPADRIEALAQAQAELAHRIEAVAAEARAPEERLQAMAGQLLGLIRDKNATFETALAGIDQLRARMRALEQIGEPAEARALLETLGGRVDALQAAQAAAAAGIEARLEALATPATGAADLAERLARLHEAEAAGTDALLSRLAPLEAKLAGLEAGPEALKRLEGRLETLAREQGAARTELAGLKAEAGGPVKALAEQLARLHAQKEALAEQLAGRIAGIEADLAGRDPQPALGRLDGRIAALEAAGEAPLAALAAELHELHAQKDAAVEAVLARLVPLEARLAGVEGRDPQAGMAPLEARLAAIEGAGDRFAALAERLHAQKDAAVEAVLARLVPLEARLAGIEGRDPQAALLPLESRMEVLAGRLQDLRAEKEAVLGRLDPLEARLAGIEGRDPQAALLPLESRMEVLAGRLQDLRAEKEAAVAAVTARLDPLEARLAGIEGRDPQAALAALGDRLGTLETAEDRFAALGERLAGLQARRDAAVEAVLGRLAPAEARLEALEAGLAARDPQAALDGLAARLEAAEELRGAAEAGLRERLGLLEGAGDRLAALGERLHAQKDAAVEAVLGRLVPLEARLAGIEGRDPQAELLPLEARLQALGDRLGTLEAAEDRLAALGDRLAGLHAQKDAALEAVLGRLQALEAGLAARDPEGALEMLAARLEAAREAAEAGLRERLAALEAPEADAFAGIAAQLGELAARKDAAVEAMLGRLAPLEARLQAIEAGGGSDRRAEDDARAEAQAIATQLIAMRAAAVQTELFADRLALLEASLPRLSVAQSLMMQALERQAAGAPAEPPAATSGPGSEDPLAAFRDLPRIVSLHQR